MSSQTKIAPSILAADPGRFAAEIQSLEQSGADWLHIDVMDGSFVPPITFGTNIVQIAKKSSSLFRDVHLMIVNPDAHIESFAQAGSDRIIVHQEACTHLHRTLGAIRAQKVANGVALNPATPVESIFHVLDICDLVLIMTVNPGWGGQPFIEECLAKITAVRAEITRRGLPTLIEVDGGINQETGARCVKAGADVLVAGTYILGSSDRASAIRSLR